MQQLLFGQQQNPLNLNQAVQDQALANDLQTQRVLNAFGSQGLPIRRRDIRGNVIDDVNPGPTGLDAFFANNPSVRSGEFDPTGALAQGRRDQQFAIEDANVQTQQNVAEAQQAASANLLAEVQQAPQLERARQAPTLSPELSALNAFLVSGNDATQQAPGDFVFGNGPGQVPEGAAELDAQLEAAFSGNQAFLAPQPEVALPVTQPQQVPVQQAPVQSPVPVLNDFIPQTTPTPAALGIPQASVLDAFLPLDSGGAFGGGLSDPSRPLSPFAQDPTGGELLRRANFLRQQRLR